MGFLMDIVLIIIMPDVFIIEPQLQRISSLFHYNSIDNTYINRVFNGHCVYNNYARSFHNRPPITNNKQSF